jgi:hypothetical protein
MPITLLQIRDEVKARASSWGVSEYDTDVKLNGLVNRRLRTFGDRARAFFSSNIRLTHGSSEGPFDLLNKAIWLMGGVTQVEMIQPVDVYIDGFLRYQADKANTSFWDTLKPFPGGWWMNSETSLQLWGAPGASSVVTVCGYYSHPDLASDSATVVLPVGAEEALIDFILEAYLEPTATSGDQLTRVRDLKARNDQVLSALRRRFGDHPMIGQRTTPGVSVFTPGRRGSY